MQLHTALLTTIVLGPPAAADNYAQAVERVEQLNESINVGEQVHGELLHALSQLPKHTVDLAADSKAREIRIRALLNLARAYLSAGELVSANGAMDEALRVALGEPLPVEDFGPSLTALHAERKAALDTAGTGAIAVNCQIPCQVYVNERAAGGEIEDLYLGVYRVWIEAKDGSGGHRPKIVHVSLNAADETMTVDYLPLPTPDSVERSGTIALTGDRVMPRGAAVALLVVGVGFAAVGGGVLGANANGLVGQTAAGATLLAVGGVTALIGGVSLTIDEVRLGRARGRQAMVSWSVNF